MFSVPLNKRSGYGHVLASIHYERFLPPSDFPNAKDALKTKDLRVWLPWAILSVGISAAGQTAAGVPPFSPAAVGRRLR